MDLQRYSKLAIVCLTGLACSDVAVGQTDEALLRIDLPVVSGNLAEFPLSLRFNTKSGEEMVFFSLDVSESRDALTAAGTDYSRFSFTPASSLAGFDPIRGTGFGVGPRASVVQFDTVTDPLPPGSYEFGVLGVDFDGTGLTVGDRFTRYFNHQSHLSALALAGKDSVIGVEPPGDPSGFRFVNLEFQVVPEPSTLLLVIPAVVFLVLSPASRRRTGLQPVG